MRGTLRYIKHKTGFLFLSFFIVFICLACGERLCAATPPPGGGTTEEGLDDMSDCSSCIADEEVLENLGERMLSGHFHLEGYVWHEDVLYLKGLVKDEDKVLAAWALRLLSYLSVHKNLYAKAALIELAGENKIRLVFVPYVPCYTVVWYVPRYVL